MRVDQCITLIGALIGLVDPLTEQCDRFFVFTKPAVEGLQFTDRQATFLRHVRQLIIRCHQQRMQFTEAVNVIFNIGVIDQIMLQQITTQAVKQPDIRSRTHGQMQIGLFRGHGFTRINHYHFHIRATCPRLLNATENDRMCPGRIRTGDHQQIGQFQIFITPRHHVFTKSPTVRHDGGRHTKTGIGINVRSADEAFHQLIGDIIIFGE